MPEVEDQLPGIPGGCEEARHRYRGGRQHTADGSEEAEVVKDIRFMKAAEVCSKWFRYSELLTVEIDTEAQTCVVAEVSP